MWSPFPEAIGYLKSVPSKVESCMHPLLMQRAFVRSTIISSEWPTVYVMEPCDLPENPHCCWNPYLSNSQGQITWHLTDKIMSNFFYLLLTVVNDNISFEFCSDYSVVPSPLIVSCTECFILLILSLCISSVEVISNDYNWKQKTNWIYHLLP